MPEASEASISRFFSGLLAKITKLPRASARATQKAAVRHLKPIGDFVHTITFRQREGFPPRIRTSPMP